MESKKLPELKEYQKKLKILLDENLLDIIIFGSFVKGGFPKDIDVALVSNRNMDFTELKKKVRNIIRKEADIQLIGIESIYSPIWLTLIKEGFSVKKGKLLSELYNLKPVVLYKHSLKKLTNVQKVQFERGIKKVIGNEGQFITRSVIMVPLSMKNELIEFFKTWKIYYETEEYELLPILRKEEL
jgi:predicted nucleotidyltransferase